MLPTDLAFPLYFVDAQCILVEFLLWIILLRMFFILYLYLVYFKKKDLGHSAGNLFMGIFLLKNSLVHKTTRLTMERIIYLSLNNDHGSLLIVSSLSLGMMLSRCTISVCYKRRNVLLKM